MTFSLFSVLLCCAVEHSILHLQHLLWDNCKAWGSKEIHGVGFAAMTHFSLAFNFMKATVAHCLDILTFNLYWDNKGGWSYSFKATQSMDESLPNEVCVRGGSCMSVFFNLGGFLFLCVVFEKIQSNEKECTMITNFQQWLAVYLGLDFAYHWALAGGAEHPKLPFKAEVCLAFSNTECWKYSL